MYAAGIYALLAYIGHYLLARATITSWLWSRYPDWLDRWAMCPACSGTWIGVACATYFGWVKHWPLAGVAGNTVLAVVLAGAWTMFTTPLLAYVHLHALARTSGEGHELDV
jgi:hypothetical protein